MTELSAKRRETVSMNLESLKGLLTVFIVCLHSNCAAFASENDRISQALFRILGTFYDTAVPAFFLISAYLFYRNFTGVRQYGRKIKSRVASVLAPYFLFSFFWMAATALLGLAPLIGSLIPDTPLNATWRENLSAFLLASYDPPIWFLRSLFALQCLSVILYPAIRSCFWAGPFFTALFVVINLKFRTAYSGVIFWLPLFACGMWLAFHEERVTGWLKRRRAALFAVFVGVFAFLFASACAAVIGGGQMFTIQRPIICTASLAPCRSLACTFAPRRLKSRLRIPRAFLSGCF